MHIVVIGTRGIPNIPGGVETHCQQLYPRIAAMGDQVTIVRRSCYITSNNAITSYQGVHLVDVYAPRSKSIEAIVHTFLATIKAKRLHADIVHIHTVGPSLLTPVARLLGLTVVCTNHGPDYNRSKWSRFAKWAIKTGEWCQARWAHHIIAISDSIAETLRKQYKRTSGVTVIPNGVEMPHKSAVENNLLTNWGIEPQQYVLAVARFVPEKRLDMLIDAFAQCNHGNIRLVIAGDADHDDEYSRMVKAKAQNTGVILTGYVTGKPLNQLWANAKLFVLPSAHEGLPIALLEAMSWHRDVLVSNISANHLPELNDDDFFDTDSTEALSAAINKKLSKSYHERDYDLSRYDWDNIATITHSVYHQLKK
ncbi:MAG: glycosyltransferase family 4 protein [Muribaculaceae bacterium]|nr:glycosyltransferase family 4 protein [Muribaculaceae bacterium]